MVARGVAGARLGWGGGGGGGGGGGVEGWGQIAFRGKLKSSCSLAWKLGVMAIKSEWVIKSCPNALNIPFRIVLWNLSRGLKNLDSLENYNSRQFLLVNRFGGCAARTDQKKCLFPTLLQTWPLISIPVLRAGKGHKRDAGRNLVIITLIRTPSKTFLHPISNSHTSLLFLSLALASSDTSEIWRLWQMLWYFTFLTSSSSQYGNRALVLTSPWIISAKFA